MYGKTPLPIHFDHNVLTNNERIDQSNGERVFQNVAGPRQQKEKRRNQEKQTAIKTTNHKQNQNNKNKCKACFANRCKPKREIGASNCKLTTTMFHPTPVSQIGAKKANKKEK